MKDFQQLALNDIAEETFDKLASTENHVERKENIIYIKRYNEESDTYFEVALTLTLNKEW